MLFSRGLVKVSQIAYYYNLFICYFRHNLQIYYVDPEMVKTILLHLPGAVCYRDICNGGEHARQDCGVRQHQETRRDRLQKSAARF